MNIISHLLTLIISSLLIIRLLIYFFLSNKNKDFIFRNSSIVPGHFLKYTSPQDYQNTCNNQIKKNNVDLIFTIYFTLNFVFWTWGGGMRVLDNALSLNSFLSNSYADLLVKKILFLLIFITSNLMPYKIKKTIYKIVSNEKKLLLANHIKASASELLIQSLLFTIVAFCFVFTLDNVIQILGPLWPVYLWSSAFLVFIIFIFLYPNFLSAKSKNGCHNFLDKTHMADSTINLLKRNQIDQTQLLVDKTSNDLYVEAFGFGSNSCIIFKHQVLELLNVQEIEAVIAHEIGHLKNHHPIKLLSLVMLFVLVFVLLFGNNYQSNYLFNGLGTPIYLALYILLAPLYIFYVTPIFCWFTRKFENDADRFASTQINTNNLSSAISKIASKKKNLLIKDHLYGWFFDKS